ncbi:hypothetical protein [Xanthomonas campestris]|uniref:hypothetical protein n=1 Tax=Xanthomonas campestris TaxID=339 RepID=UPI003556440E
MSNPPQSIKQRSSEMDGDYSSILSGLAVGGAVAAIIGAGVLKAAPGFARWLTNKVATFFR